MTFLESYKKKTVHLLCADMDDGLTPKYLSAILLENYQAKRGEACECVTLKEVVAEPIGVGQGFLGCIKRIHLKYRSSVFLSHSKRLTTNCLAQVAGKGLRCVSFICYCQIPASSR